MKKRIRRLKLERETIRELTPERLEQVVGGNPEGGTDWQRPPIIMTLAPSCVDSEKCR